MTVQEMDVRVGGSYRYTHRSPGSGPFVFFGEFREVEPPRSLVQTFQFEGSEHPPSLDRAEFEELKGDRTRIVAIASFDSIEARDAMTSASAARMRLRRTGSTGAIASKRLSCSGYPPCARTDGRMSRH